MHSDCHFFFFFGWATFFVKHHDIRDHVVRQFFFHPDVDKRERRAVGAAKEMTPVFPLVQPKIFFLVVPLNSFWFFLQDTRRRHRAGYNENIECMDWIETTLGLSQNADTCVCIYTNIYYLYINFI